MSKIEYREEIVYVDAAGVSTGYYAIPRAFDKFKPGNPHDIREPIFEVDADGDDVVPDDFVYLDGDEDAAARFLAVMVSEDDFDSVVTYHPSNHLVEIGNREYFVMTDIEADAAWEVELDRYLDECVLSELTGVAAQYFDSEAWKRDARADGRGHSLSAYDGNEEDITIGSETYYLFRQN